MRKTAHMSLCLAGVLKDWRRWQGTILNLDDTPAKKADIQALYDQGVRVLPLSGEPCEGWSDETGCPGHEQPDDLTPALGAVSKGVPDHG